MLATLLVAFFLPRMLMLRGPRLLPFFQLPGRLLWSREVVQVELRPFNNRQLNRDLLAVCQRVNEFQPREFAFSDN